MDWPLLAALTEPERTDLIGASRSRTFARGEVVCHAGDLADSLHLIAEGRLAVRVSMESGDGAMINVIGPGDYFGELALLRGDHRRTATVTALEPARTVVITSSAFRRVSAVRPGVERALTVALADRVDELSRRLLEMMFLSLDRRVYRRLLELADSYEAGDVPIVVPFTQSQLAELTGGTRPSVNQSLQRLVDEGIVALQRGRIDVHDVEALRRRSGA